MKFPYDWFICAELFTLILDCGCVLLWRVFYTFIRCAGCGHFCDSCSLRFLLIVCCRSHFCNTSPSIHVNDILSCCSVTFLHLAMAAVSIGADLFFAPFLFPPSHFESAVWAFLPILNDSFVSERCSMIVVSCIQNSLRILKCLMDILCALIRWWIFLWTSITIMYY